jgi:hypothetical protein
MEVAQPHEYSCTIFFWPDHHNTLVSKQSPDSYCLLWEKNSPLVSKQSHDSYCLLREKKFASTALSWVAGGERLLFGRLHTGDTVWQLATDDAAPEGHKDVQWTTVYRSIQLKKTYIQVTVVFICWVYRCISSCKYKNKLSMPYSIKLLPWHSRPIAVRKFTVI